MTTVVKDDLALRKRVEEELQWDTTIDARKIGVAVEDGVVQLTGEVPTYTDRWRAERAVERVAGVRGIANDIEVKVTAAPSDVEIAKRATEKLEWNVAVPSGAVTVKVDNGWITLKGEVRYDYQRRAAERAVRDIPGVRGVSNLITLAPKVEPKNLKEQIEKTFVRQATLDANNIDVETDGSTVILRGTVRSWAERRDAERIALSAPGVTSVKNEIKIAP
jgi:osmotically-inducible protein OsmY